MGQRSKIVQLSGIGYFETLDQSGRHLLRRYLWTYSPDRSSREGGGAGSLRILGNFKMNKKKFIMETRCMRLYHETIWILTGLPFFMSTRWGDSLEKWDLFPFPPSGGQGNSFWTRMDTCAFNSIGETTVKSQYPCPMVNQFKHLYRGPVVTSILTKNCKKQSPLREWKTYSEARFWC